MSVGSAVALLIKHASLSTAVLVGLYASFIGLLTLDSFQTHVIYLHKIQMTWFKDLNTPEIFGFLHNQVTPFGIPSPSGNAVFAWHILPIELYRKNEVALLAESSGYTQDIRTRHAFKLLREDPDAILAIHMHGAAGTVGSGYRVPNYRALSAGDPNKIHVLTFDYRGFGRSKGTPTEEGVRQDAVAVVQWALEVAEIPPERIIIFGQSMGTAVNLAVAEDFALQSPSIVFAGHVLVAPFVDAATLMATYQIAGTIPLLGPIANIPPLFSYLKRYLVHKWSSKDRIAAYIHANEASGAPYRITIIHAEDDYDVPWTHSQELFWHAVNATKPNGVSRVELEHAGLDEKHDLGPAGTVTKWATETGIVREEILKTGLHDVIMGNQVVTLAVMRILDSR
ncbi:alpha/beta-hydrolase [Rhizodiscina lignyota]|uniref:Alpha/beta-hydrolase n=1 Tax=Rhizodiscina lignyota TaxID=1504668 RepID=A0A9P4M0V3_9PEZI|nr:alpha/beta-hydrolase [Rhizodiscina lignyota]